LEIVRLGNKIQDWVDIYGELKHEETRLIEQTLEDRDIRLREHLTLATQSEYPIMVEFGV
jgi:hypothetical protein